MLGAVSMRTRTNITLNIGGGGKRHRRDTLEGRPHIVVPCTMLVEGVINGSGGPLFYPKEENGKNPSRWNNMPIVVYHPMTPDGKPKSAREPAVINSRGIGRLLNTQHDDALRTECWFDEERTRSIDQRVYTAITNDIQMEVSTGLGLEVEETPGTYNEIAYNGIARDHEPDHLAILPDKVGACSIPMGGGLFANEEKEPESLRLVLHSSLANAVKAIGVKADVGNELSFDRITGMLCEALSAKYGEKGKYWRGYIQETFSDYVVFSDGNGNLMSIGYTADDSSVSLKDDAVPVVRVVEYVTADGQAYVGNQSGSLVLKERSMPFDKKAHLDALTANGQIDAGQRAEFEKLSDTVLQAMKVVTPTPAPVANQNPVPTPTPIGGQAPVQLTMEQLKQVLPPQFWAVHNQGQKALEKTKADLISTIMAAPGNKFDATYLNNMQDLDLLSGMAEIAKSVTVQNQQTAANGGMFQNGWQPPIWGGASGPAPVLNSGQDDDVGEGLLPPQQIDFKKSAAA